MESLDSGKPIRDCALVDIPETIHTLLWHAEAIDKIYDQTAPAGDDAIAMIVREPVGVVGCVLPWNFPLLMLAWKIAPALAAGNSVIVKPAEQTSLTALRVAELAMEAGIPAGVLNVIPGMGPEVGEPLGLHNDVDMISFTGSTETGRRFLRYSADSNLKKIVLECGGKNPAVVLDDAEDLDLVAEHIINAAFWNMGENCSANSRLIVQEGIKQPLLERMIAHLRDWRTGDPLNPAHNLGALVDQEHFNKVCSYLDTDTLGNAKVIQGAEHRDGCYVLPTIIDNVKAGDKLAQEEIFGPVLSIITVKTVEEAIAVANDTEYGLTASVFSANGKKALRAARAIRAGTVTINCYGEGDISTPFGGYKQSGFGGRDNSLHAHDQYTELKTIWIDLSDRAPEEAVD
jgi:gamma-glutamyl-gamma-aminobutyraldehyde dehydrogenase